MLVPLSDIELMENNPRSISDADLSKLCQDIKRDPNFLLQRPPLLNHITKSNRFVCYAGHQRVLAARKNGRTEIHAWIECDVPKAVQDERMLKDNLHRGAWDYDKLTSFDKDFLIDSGFSMKDLSLNMDSARDEKSTRKSLKEMFIVPPFSVLDSRQGYWQDRKKLWYDLGLNSSESREETETTGTLSGSVPKYYEIKNKVEKTVGHKLSNSDFEKKYLSDFMDDNSIIKQTSGGGILSVFDPVLCEVIYNWFTPDTGSLILDPFAGGSVRGIVAGIMGHEYIGVDLRYAQVEANRKQAEKLKTKGVSWIAGDSQKLSDLIPEEQMFDLIFSCPPYFDLEVYSDDPADLSNMPFNEFFPAYETIIYRSLQRLRENRFACFVVGDIRDESGCYRNFVSKTIDAFTSELLCDGIPVNLYNEIILLNQIGSLPIRAGRQFSSSRKVGKCHQNVMVFFKGNPSRIKVEFPKLINIEKYLQDKNYEPNIALSVTD